MKRGYVHLWRKIMSNPLYREERKFSRFEAWIYLFLNANGKDKEIIFDGRPLLIKRGQLLTSQRQLAARWGWSKTKTADFLKNSSKHDHAIEIISDRKKSIITILNYDRYNPPPSKKKTTENKEKKTTEKPLKDHRLAPTNKDINKDNKYSEKFQKFISHWNSKKKLRILQNRETQEREDTKKELKGVLNKGYSFEDILEAVNNYDIIISNPDKYYFDYCWPPSLFLRRGLKLFLSVNKPLNNFLRKESKQLSKPDPSEETRRLMELLK